MRPAVLGLLAVLTGCTSITVKPLAEAAPSHVCIQENPKVIVEDFLPVLRNRLDYHGIGSEVVGSAVPVQCEWLLSYSAHLSWAYVTYMSQADLRLERHGIATATAEYHLIFKGGWSLYKWQSTETKMNPVIDALLGKATLQN